MSFFIDPIISGAFAPLFDPATGQSLMVRP
nr:MAG TPA: protein of unknown function DUF4585 [Caudoviricetes sp.]